MTKKLSSTMYLNSPVYRWAIDSDRPHNWAKRAAYLHAYGSTSTTMEAQLGDRLTFTKVKVAVMKVTADAFLANVRINTNSNVNGLGLWIPRSNIRSDDDKRMDEIATQLDGTNFVNTFVFVADWYVASKQWKVNEK